MPAATFTTVPRLRFETDIFKTWLKFFKSDPNFERLSIRSKHPNIDKDLVLPILVLKPVSSEDWSLDRLSGYFGALDKIGDATRQVRLEGFSFKTMYQFDLLTYNRGDQLAWKSLIDEKLLYGSIGGNAFASNAPGHMIIPVLDFPSPEDETGAATDLFIQFRTENISGQEVETFDPELHQFSISVMFWVNFIQGRDERKIGALDVLEPTLES